MQQEKRIFSAQRHHERGQTILFVALALVSLLGMAALAIDVVTLYVARSEIQRAADATALAAAKAVADSGYTTLPAADPNIGSATLLANTMATAAMQPMTSANAPNLVAGAPPVLAVPPTINLNNQGDARITVTLQSGNLPTFFSKIWGRGTAIVTATAAAEAYNPANIGSFTPITPTSLKPWLVANIDPIQSTPFINILSGAIEQQVTGEIFNLTTDCATGTPNCALLRNPPSAPSIGGLNPQVDYVPLQVVANTKNVCPSGLCGGGSPYEESIECADATNTYVAPTCGVGTPPITNAFWDNTVNPGGGAGISATGAECLIHASTSGATKGQDLLIEPSPIFSAPMQIKAQSGPQNGNLVTTSNSIVTIPIIDNSMAPGTFPKTGGPVTVVGYMQAFINWVDDGTNGSNAGDINVTVLNIAGCSATPAAVTPVVGGAGTSPVPVRLITPP